MSAQNPSAWRSALYVALICLWGLAPYLITVAAVVALIVCATR